MSGRPLSMRSIGIRREALPVAAAFDLPPAGRTGSLAGAHPGVGEELLECGKVIPSSPANAEQELGGAAEMHSLPSHALDSGGQRKAVGPGTNDGHVEPHRAHSV